MDEHQRDVLRAQLITVSYLQSHLPLYPMAWVIRHIRHDLCYIYVRERTKYLPVQVLGSYLFFTFVFPPLVSRSLLPYACKETNFEVEKEWPETAHPLRSFDAHATGCKLQDFIHSPWNALTVTGPSLFITAAILASLLQHVFANQQRIRRRILYFARPMLPRLFYNGLGPAESDNSAFFLLKRNFLAHHYSYWHDLMGSLDLVVCCLALAATVLLGFVLRGFLLSGLAGVVAGATLGVFAARAMFFVLNMALGASDNFISYVEEQLRAHHPYEEVLHLEGTQIRGIKTANVTQKVKDAAKMVMDNGNKAKERTGWDGQGLEHLVQSIQTEGEAVLTKVARWLFEHKDGLFCTHGVCLRLFNSNTVFTADKLSIASLALMDVPLFLACYFDPNWDVLSHFVNYSLEPWSPIFRLATVYISYPQHLLCKRQQDGKWDIIDMTRAKRELEEDNEGVGAGYTPL